MKPRDLWCFLVAAVYILVRLGFVVESARLGDGGVKVQVPRSRKTLEAYATLLYGDEFLLGVRVLGKSIRDTGTTRDMVALVSDGVSPYAVQLLQGQVGSSISVVFSLRRLLEAYIFISLVYLGVIISQTLYSLI